MLIGTKIDMCCHCTAVHQGNRNVAHSWRPRRARKRLHLLVCLNETPSRGIHRSIRLSCGPCVKGHYHLDTPNVSFNGSVLSLGGCVKGSESVYARVGIWSGRRTSLTKATCSARHENRARTITLLFLQADIFILDWPILPHGFLVKTG